MPDEVAVGEGTSSLKEMIDRYPNVSVRRDRLGDISVTRTFPQQKDLRMFIHTGRDSMDQTFPDIKITVGLRDSKSEHSFAEPTYLKVRPIDEENNELIVSDEQESVDPEEVIHYAITGLDMFEALLSLPPKERGVYQTKIYDAMQPGLEKELEGLGVETDRKLRDEVERMGMKLPDPRPEEKYKYMRDVLVRNTQSAKGE